MTTLDLHAQINSFRSRREAAIAQAAVAERRPLLPASWMVPEPLHHRLLCQQFARWLAANVVVDPRAGRVVTA